MNKTRSTFLSHLARKNKKKQHAIPRSDYTVLCPQTGPAHIINLLNQHKQMTA